MFIVLQVHCLNLCFWESRPGQTLSQRANHATTVIVTRTKRRARTLLRTSGRRSVTLGIAMASLLALTAQHLVKHVEVAAASVPLAPLPLPPAAPSVPLKKHHFLGSPLRGLASWYGSMWNGHRTASGETYDDSQLTAAHKSLPLGTLVRVTNLSSMRSVVVRINDRGALAPNRVIDLSSAAAREIGMIGQGLAKVRLEVVSKL